MRITTSTTLCALLAIAAIAGCARSEREETKAAAPVDTVAAATPRDDAARMWGDGAAAKALRRARERGRYVFILFYNAEDVATRGARESLDDAMRAIGSSADWTAVDIRSAGEAAVVKKYNLRTTPMPVVLAFAPNGAVTGGFRTADILEEKLKAAIASRGTQECMKALQDGKIVFVCCQGRNTRLNKEATRGVDEFRADARYAAYTAVVMVDPADAAEQTLLVQLKMDPRTKQAMTALLVPPNVMLGVAAGATSKAYFIKQLASASSGCGAGGCGPSGCGPVRK